MTGKELKAKIKAKGIKSALLAQKLGVVGQNMQQYYKSNNLTTSTLEQIAEAIGESVSYFYNELPIFSIEDYTRVKNLEREVEYLNRLLVEKERTIEILINKKK